MNTINKIKSVKMCLMAHPDNEKDSEFEDRISDLEEIENNFSEMFDLLSTIENDNNQLPEWLWNKIQQLLTKITEL